MKTEKQNNSLNSGTSGKIASKKNSRKQRGRWVIPILVVAIVLISSVFISTRGSASDGIGDQTVEVRRGDLLVTVTESGSMRAKESIQYKCRVERRRGGVDVSILSLVPPGTYVTQEDVDNGMILVELDSSSLRDQLQQEEMELAGDKEQYTAAKEAYDIQIIQNESDVAAAQLRVRFALMDLEKYLGKELAEEMTKDIGSADDLSEHVAPYLERIKNDPNLLEGSSAGQEMKKLRDSIVQAEGNLKISEDKLAGTEKLHEAEYVSDLELEGDRLEVVRGEFAYEDAQLNLDLYLKYDFLKNAEQYLSDYIEAGRELERTFAQCRSRLAQAQASLNNADERLNSQTTYVNELRQQIEYCTIRAIAPGLVIYGEGGSDDTYRAMRGGSGSIVAEGEVVYEGQTLISMPDTAAMVAEVSVHEIEVDKVRPGQPCQIVMDAFPDKILEGEVLEVAPLPDQQRGWMNPDTKVYKTLVSIEGTHDFLRTRMSCKVEILVRRLEDVLMVPIQVVANRGGQKVCYVSTPTGPEERIVTTGAFTDMHVQIIEGLEEGEEVLLNPPLFDELSGNSAFERSQESWGDRGNDLPETGGETGGAEPMQEQQGPAAMRNAMVERFRQMDTDGDGKISLSGEVPEQARQFLERLDTNSDGFIDNDEMEQAGQQMRGGGRGGMGAPSGGGRGGMGAPGGERGGRRSPNQGGGSQSEQAL